MTLCNQSYTSQHFLPWVGPDAPNLPPAKKTHQQFTLSMITIIFLTKTWFVQLFCYERDHNQDHPWSFFCNSFYHNEWEHEGTWASAFPAFFSISSSLIVCKHLSLNFDLNLDLNIVNFFQLIFQSISNLCSIFLNLF